MVPRRSLPLLPLVALLAACGGDDGSRTVTVFAAASLTDAFDDLAAAFEDTEPDVDVALSYGGSSSLRAQLEDGAPADVFASADDADAGEPFATNQLQIAVPVGNGAGVTGLADLADADLLIGLCAEQVPCGRFAREALANAGIAPSIDTNEPDVRSLLTKVEAGELDAGIVYATDVRTGDVDGVDIPAAVNVTLTYPIASLTDDGDGFVDFVLSDDGQAVLADHGFGRP